MTQSEATPTEPIADARRRQAALIEANNRWQNETRTHAIRRDSFIQGAEWAEARVSAPLDEIANLVKRHTHDEAHVLIYDLRGPQRGCLLCRALVAAGVLSIDQIGADTRARLTEGEKPK